MKDLITPNKSIQSASTITIIWIVGTLLLWMFSGSKVFPGPQAILLAGKDLIIKHEFFTHLLISTSLCIKAIAYSIIISLIIALMSVIPLMRPFTSISSKARFLSTVGLTFIFAQITASTNDLKVFLLVFCISIFMITSFLSIISEIKREELDYVRTLKFGEWQVVWEIMILGKIDQYLESIKQNFAIAWIMLAMVENLCRAEGGIGVMLFNENKQFHLDSVWAIQIIVLAVGIGLDWTLGFIRRVFCPYSVITLNKK